MCLPAVCQTCSKTTWKGCGRHIESVQKTVPADQWCVCADDDRNPGTILNDLLTS